MRMLMKVWMPVEPFNTLVRNGTAGAKIQQILEDLKPEAAYFTAQDGHRGGIIVVNIGDTSEIPRFAEPFFLNFNALGNSGGNRRIHFENHSNGEGKNRYSH